MNEQQMQFSYDRRRTSTLTLDEQPGAHTGATRKYIPGYSDSNIVFLNTSTGNDANTGASIAQALLTYSAAATAAGSTKKIRLVNSATLTSNITKPTEATIGTTSSITGSSTTPVNVFTQAATPGFGASTVDGITWFQTVKKFVAVGGSGKIYTSPDGDTWTVAATPSFGSTRIRAVAASTKLGIVVAVAEGKLGYSYDGSAWVQAENPLITAGYLRRVVWANYAEAFFAVSTAGEILKSTDGISWAIHGSVSFGTATQVEALCVSERLGYLIVGGDDTSNGKISWSEDGITWTATATTAIGAQTCYDLIDSEVSGKIVAVANTGVIAHSTDAVTFTAAVTPGFGADLITTVISDDELGVYVAGDLNGTLNYSTDAITWTSAGTPSFGGSYIMSRAYSPALRKVVFGSSDGKIGFSSAYTVTVSASIAGFSVVGALFSGTATAYNCTFRQPSTSADLSLESCRISYESHLYSNAAESVATLYEGDRHTTCTPASQNAIDMNLDTVAGIWYINNSSQTGYERIRDCLVTGGIVADYPVTVGGRANVEGTSVNVLFDAEVTHNDPRFVDETDYKLEFQTNGYTRNSFAAGRSNLYFNSAGDARDIGAWSYVESAVSHYYAKTEVIYKGEISHGLEFALNEQQGDSGVVSVYGNTRRVKEVITITYGTTYQREKAIFEYMLTLQDKGVKIQLDAEWSDNAGTVVVNGNQSAGVEFLTVDSTVYYEGMWLTIAGKQYWVMRASPSPSVATKLILDRPLEDAVLDNDVIVRNYPAGAGEYQFSGPMNLTLKRVHPTALQGYYSGFQIRLVRKKQ